MPLRPEASGASAPSDDNVFYIDYARNGANHRAWNGFRGWDWPSYSGYADAPAVPAIADYDGDGTADLSVKDAGGTWYVDYASNGFAGLDDLLAGYGGSWSTAIRGHCDGMRDPQADKRRFCPSANRRA